MQTEIDQSNNYKFYSADRRISPHISDLAHQCGSSRS